MSIPTEGNSLLKEIAAWLICIGFTVMWIGLFWLGLKGPRGTRPRKRR